MERRELGPGGPAVPVIGLGTWQMERDAPAATAAIHRAMDLGVTHIDTAEMYGAGAAEEIVGRAIAGRRHEVFLVSKVLPGNGSFEGTLRACEASLRRLKTETLDLYLLHWPGPHPLAETFRAFDQLEHQGKIHAFGVSNFDVEDLEEALAVAGEGRVACNQVLYHLGERYIEHQILPWCQRHGVAVVGYSPFGSGEFPPRSTTRAGRRQLWATAEQCRITVRQAALRFLVRHEGSFTIPKASDLNHLVENAGAGDIALSAHALDQIDAAFPLGEPRDGLPMI